MGTETFINYWIGQEPTGPGKSPTLDQMPAYVDVVPLAFVHIDENEQLDFGFLCQQNPASVIQGWIKTVQKNGTKVTLSINSTALGTISNPQAFVQTVKQSMAEWSVDGVDLDYEPSTYTYNQTLINVVSELRQALGPDALITAPIYSRWLTDPSFLRDFAAELDFLTTMDYSGYPGFGGTTTLFNQYAQAIGTPSQPAYSKVAIGMSCMGPPTSGNFTPLHDVKELCGWEPEGGTKKGAMLYTFSYDIQTRPGSGTGQPDGTWTRTIHEQLP
jgi:Glycosyl hydrolases family 18